MIASSAHWIPSIQHLQDKKKALIFSTPLVEFMLQFSHGQKNCVWTCTTTSEESITLYSSPQILLLCPFSNIVCLTRSLKPSSSSSLGNVEEAYFCSNASEVDKIYMFMQLKLKQKVHQTRKCAINNPTKFKVACSAIAVMEHQWLTALVD